MEESANTAYAADEARWSALMISAQAGHEADYRNLLGEVSVVVSNYLRSRIGAHEFLDDCVQETLIAVHQARHTYDPKRKFRPWLFAIVRHKAVDALRKQHSVNKLNEQQSEILETHTDPEREDSSFMSGRLLESLSAPYREAITLTKIIGLSTTEAATQLSISESALKVRTHRAIGKLRQLMEVDQL